MELVCIVNCFSTDPSFFNKYMLVIVSADTVIVSVTYSNFQLCQNFRWVAENAKTRHFPALIASPCDSAPVETPRLHFSDLETIAKVATDFRVGLQQHCRTGG